MKQEVSDSTAPLNITAYCAARPEKLARQGVFDAIREIQDEKLKRFVVGLFDNPGRKFTLTGNLTSQRAKAVRRQLASFGVECQIQKQPAGKEKPDSRSMRQRQVQDAFDQTKEMLLQKEEDLQAREAAVAENLQLQEELQRKTEEHLESLNTMQRQVQDELDRKSIALQQREEDVQIREAAVEVSEMNVESRDMIQRQLQYEIDKKNDLLQKREVDLQNREGVVADAIKQFAAKAATQGRLQTELDRLRSQLRQREEAVQAREAEAAQKEQYFEAEAVAQLQLQEALESKSAELRQREIDLEAREVAATNAARQFSVQAVTQPPAKYDQDLSADDMDGKKTGKLRSGERGDGFSISGAIRGFTRMLHEESPSCRPKPHHYCVAG